MSGRKRLLLIFTASTVSWLGSSLSGFLEAINSGSELQMIHFCSHTNGSLLSFMQFQSNGRTNHLQNTSGAPLLPGSLWNRRPGSHKKAKGFAVRCCEMLKFQCIFIHLSFVRQRT